MKAYKAFKKDLTCRGFQYKEGETYTIASSPVICEYGFHFCKYIAQTLEYYPVENLNDNAYAEVEILGDIVWDEGQFKGCTNSIKIVRIIPDSEIEQIFDQRRNTGNWNTGNCNTGDRNTGDCNTGDYNTGYRNTGYRNTGYRNTGDRNTGNWNTSNWNTGNWNTGDRNTGDRNTGNWNTGNWNTGNWNTGNCNTGDRNTGDWNTVNKETGFFNTVQSKTIRVFNKDCLLEEWEKVDKPDWLYFVIDPEIGYKGSFQIAYYNADKSEQKKVKRLPNFDAEVFFEISGIDLR